MSNRFYWLASLLLVACSDKDAAPPAVNANDASNRSTSSTIDSGLQDFAAVSNVSALEISISLSGIDDEIIEQGEPLHIAVRLRAARNSNEVFELAPASGTWVDAISVDVIGPDGTFIAKAESVGIPDNTQAVIDATRLAGGLWRISAEISRLIPAGNHVVRARLVIQDGSGWIGEIISDELPLQIVAMSDSAGRVAQRAISLARDALLGDKLEQAAGLLDSVLENSPDDVRILTLRGSIALRAGNPLAAMICVNRAQQATSGNGTDLPPLELDALRQRVMTALQSATGESKDAPLAWTWPPSSVMLFADSRATAVSNGSEVPVSTAATPVTTGKWPGVVVPPSELDDTAILAEPSGQWAITSSAGSEYGTTSYGAVQLIGPPNVRGSGGDSGEAWCHSPSSTELEWVELGYSSAVHATEVRVRQNNVPGTIVKVEAIEPDGTAHIWWEGVDPYPPADDIDLAWFAVRVPATAYLVAKIRITLNLAAIPGWKEIDAVQLLGHP